MPVVWPISPTKAVPLQAFPPWPSLRRHKSNRESRQPQALHLQPDGKRALKVNYDICMRYVHARSVAKLDAISNAITHYRDDRVGRRTCRDWLLFVTDVKMTTVNLVLATHFSKEFMLTRIGD